MSDERVASAMSLFNEQIRGLQEQLRRKQRLVNELCEEIGQPPLYQIEDGGQGGVLAIQPGEFFTKPLATTVTSILQRRQKAGLSGPALVDEIYPLMIQGGFLFDAKNEANAKRSLAIVLAKNPKFVRLPSEHIGLAEWYDLPKQRAKDADKKTATDAGATAQTAEDDESKAFQEQFNGPDEVRTEDSALARKTKSKGDTAEAVA